MILRYQLYDFIYRSEMNPFLAKNNYCIFYGYFFIVYSATENKGAEEIKNAGLFNV